MPDVIRTFIALDVAQSVRQEVERLLVGLRCAGADVKWSNPQQIHLTLKFLGDTPSGQIPEIASVIERLAQRHAPLTLTVTTLGAFPDLRRPRIVWLGVDGDVDALHRLQNELEQRLSAIGIPHEERAFHPHLTLGRVRTPKRLQELVRRLSEPQELAFDVSWQGDRIALFQSTLTPDGPIYRVLNAMMLDGV